MTYRLVPVGSGGQAEAVPGGMLVEIILDHAIGDIAGGGREVAPRPETLPPIVFANVFELLLDLAQGAAFRPAHQVAVRDVRRDFGEQVDGIA